MPRRIVAGTVAVLGIAFAVTAAGYRATYGTPAFWGPPQRITWCGRNYLISASAPRTRVQLEAERVSLPGDAPYPVVQVDVVPPVVGRPLLAAVTPGSGALQDTVVGRAPGCTPAADRSLTRAMDRLRSVTAAS